MSGPVDVLAVLISERDDVRGLSCSDQPGERHLRLREARLTAAHAAVAELIDALQAMTRAFSPHPRDDTEGWREEHEACELARAALAAQAPQGSQGGIQRYIVVLNRDGDYVDEEDANGSYVLHADHVYAMASQAKRMGESIAAAREALESIRQYGADTLSGRADGPDDRQWQRESVLEMTRRASAAIGGAK